MLTNALLRYRVVTFLLFSSMWLGFAAPTFADSNRLGGISTRSYVGNTPENYMIAGVFVNGSAKKVVVRASSVDGILNPNLTIKSYPEGKVLFSNSDWVTGISATELRQTENGKWMPAKQTDAALIITLQPGLFTMEVAPESSPGVGIIEVYELNSTAKLGGISTRSYVGTNPSDYMIAGVFVQGDPKKLIVRGSSVDGVLNPRLTIKSYPEGKVLFENTDWVTGTSASELRTLEGGKWMPGRQTDATLIVTLNPGLYTLEVSPEGNTGVGIVEVYEHPLYLGNGTTSYTLQSVCKVDSTQTPEMSEYAEITRLLCENHAFPIWEKLYGSTSSPSEIKIFFKKGLRVPGQTVGGVGINSFIELSAEYLTQKPQEKNVVIHEMVHVAQSYSGVNPIPPSWIIEGMADYVTHILGFSYDWTHPTCQGGLHYTQGYWCGSAFFSFLEKTYDSELIFRINMAIKANRYNDSLFESYTGKSLEQLWQECLQRDCVGGKQDSLPIVRKFASNFKRVEYYKPIGYCSSNMVLVWLLFEVTGVNFNNLMYIEEKSVYQTDITNPYVEPIQAVNSEGFVVRGFCAPSNLKSDFQVRLRDKSSGELSNAMAFTVDVNSAVIIQQAPPLKWLSAFL